MDLFAFAWVLEVYDVILIRIGGSFYYCGFDYFYIFMFDRRAYRRFNAQGMLPGSVGL